MNNNIIKYSLLILALVFLQVIVFNNILFNGYINPLIYLIFIFIYPIHENKTKLLLLSFTLGIIIDFFSNSGGSNAASLVFVAYLRLPILRLIQSNKEFDFLLFNIKKLNSLQIIIYVFSLTFLHHILLFYLESYTLNNFNHIFLKALYSSLLSSLIIVLSLTLFIKNKQS